MNSSTISFNNYNIVSNFNYYINVGFIYRNNDVINYTRYDDAGKQIVTYDNISGNKTFNVNAFLIKLSNGRIKNYPSVRGSGWCIILTTVP
ncbi:hypothetical protein EJ377_14185 [Chryseobacterium arthrosphaerae]|uniref:Uncharacterized protein n=1 Tax=Chryseobacterium arthrosphaerae TaxID=651561 RepID=A0A3S0Q3S2_9FLAO|nr:hypothetical protein EJ377_14185 [Chryseobacterium arthrosphaerae]